MTVNTEPIKNIEKYNESGRLTADKLNSALSEALKKIDANLESFKTSFPSHASVNNVYEHDDNSDGWNQGFWTGILWIAYELTGDEKYRVTAEAQLESYAERIEKRIGVNHHDMGFLYIPSCVAAYKLTGNEKAKKSALMAADALMERFHEKGGFIQAWGEIGAPENYRLIIDCLLNIPLLYWASEVTGDDKYEKAAYSHFNATAANILREDGSTYHTFYFDPETGVPVKGVTHQGKADNSCWARGQAWGIYGFMLTYMYKHDEKCLDLFKCVSNYFLNRLPKDYITYWDMIFTDGDEEERDSSSAAIALCGLIEGAAALDEDDNDKKMYLNAVHKIMNSLIDNYSTKDSKESNGLLLHAVYAKPQGNGVDECNIWGDYFYMEALARLIKGNSFKGYW